MARSEALKNWLHERFLDTIDLIARPVFWLLYRQPKE